MVANQHLGPNDLLWQQRLIKIKEQTEFSFQTLARRLKAQPSNVFRVHAGTLKMPMAMRARLLDFDSFVSVRAICFALLPEETVEHLSNRHNAYIGQNMIKDLKPLPKNVIDALEKCDEHQAWVGILDELKLTFGSDQNLATKLGTTRSLLSVVRTVKEKRLPTEIKLRALDIANFVINDELLLTLMPSLVIEVVNMHISDRPHSDPK